MKQKEDVDEFVFSLIYHVYLANDLSDLLYFVRWYTLIKCLNVQESMNNIAKIYLLDSTLCFF